MTFDTMANNKIQRSQNHGFVFARGTANKVYVDQRFTCLLFWPADLVIGDVRAERAQPLKV